MPESRAVTDDIIKVELSSTREETPTASYANAYPINPSPRSRLTIYLAVTPSWALLLLV